MNHTLLGAIALSLTVSSLTAQWTQAAPAASPTARSGATMCTTPAGNVILFGGSLNFGATNQTWSYNGTTWTQVTTTGTPQARSNMDLVYDPTAGVYRLYGGVQFGFIGSTVYDQTWEFDGSAWTQNIIVGPTPGGLCQHGTSYDTVHNVMVVYGGLPNPTFPIDSNRTWEFDGTGWAETAVSPAVNPGPLERPAMCFHIGIGKTVLFGGIDVQTGGNDKTWLYDAGTNSWSELVVTGPKPAPRTGAKMAYDPVRGVCVMTGGADWTDPTGQTYFTDTWEFNGQVWTQVATGVAGGRMDSPLAYMPSRNRMVQFGGANFATFVIFNDTWEWESGSFGSGCAGTNGTPRLSVDSSPRLGQSWTVTASNVNPALNLGILAFGFTQLPGVDLGPVLGMPGCLAFTTPDVITSLLSGNSGSFSWTWPSVFGSVGDRFFAQALCLDPTVNAFGFTISNAIAVTVGL
ncbi:MAG: hypothetical protein KF830_02955 [Planctomycetes bacterium]|nr:hypothetical protein [Planctomycetota bacterium]